MKKDQKQFEKTVNSQVDAYLTSLAADAKWSNNSSFPTQISVSDQDYLMALHIDLGDPALNFNLKYTNQTYKDYILSGANFVESITGTPRQVLVDNTDPLNPILSAPQNLDFDAYPIFMGINLQVNSNLSSSNLKQSQTAIPAAQQLLSTHYTESKNAVGSVLQYLSRNTYAWVTTSGSESARVDTFAYSQGQNRLITRFYGDNISLGAGGLYLLNCPTDFGNHNVGGIVNLTAIGNISCLSASVSADAVTALQLVPLQQLNAGLATKLSLSGGTMTGNLILNGAPTLDLQAATKKYVDDNTPADGVTSITGTANQILVDNSDPQNPVLSTPQDIATTSSPAFSRVNFGGGTEYIQLANVNALGFFTSGNLKAVLNAQGNFNTLGVGNSGNGIMSLANFGDQSTSIPANFYSISVYKKDALGVGVSEGLIAGVSRNSTWNEIPANAVFLSTINGSSSIKLGRGNGSTLPYLVDMSVGDQNGNVTTPKKSAFSAFVTNPKVNITGDGSGYTLTAYDGENYDRNSNFDPLTGLFTAPVNGVYHLGCRIWLSGLTASHTIGAISVYSGGAASELFALNTANARIASGDLVLAGSIDVLLNAGQTAYVFINVSGGAKTVGIEFDSRFFGHLVG